MPGICNFGQQRRCAMSVAARNLAKEPSYNVPGGHREDENRESELHGERLRVLRVYCCENDIVVILSWSLDFIFLPFA